MKKTILVLLTFSLVLTVAGCGFWLTHYFIDAKEQRTAFETLSQEYVLFHSIHQPVVNPHRDIGMVRQPGKDRLFFGRGRVLFYDPHTAIAISAEVVIPVKL